MRKTSRGARTRAPGLAAGLALTALLTVSAACGSTSDNGSPKPGDAVATDPAERRVQLARCLRDNGVQVSDPKTRQDLMQDLGEARKANGQKVRKAIQACQRYLGGEVQNLLTTSEGQDALVRWAQCMRQNEINVPDPTNGMPNLRGIDTNSPAFAKANKECSKHLPGMGGS
ncbi:hypothetical protein Acsp03_49540 [Actinomadura sp. NBRC 104412]|uniref:hypothetical protein n=1 Tax=Actinomadura sp. NBRC 104412 TaxID=3032203 RepID=UPI0024A327FA|nr:hypothetical protein [Actinomadura sp. NBRC 104412]GLZ07488.1 hypothetical protein Acsp03_49540 [Actinomadura sp. NBRC 104412]